MDRMVHTNTDRKDLAAGRIAHRSYANSFENIIREGTSCSPFEAKVIANKAIEVFRLDEFNDDHKLQPGQMIWRAIRETEPVGKPLKECVYDEIRLTIHNLEEDPEIRRQYGHSAKRQQQILRISTEAYEQGTLLTQDDLGMLLDCDVTTIQDDMKKLQAKLGILVPTRGNKKDIGPGVTHREKAISLFLEGKDQVAISREMSHSLKAVERYIHGFARVVYAQTQTGNNLSTALIVGLSVATVNKYLNLKEKYHATPEYKARVEEIEAVGTQFWQCEDAKKKLGQKKRGPK